VIPYGKQNICQADIDAVVEVLRSDWLTQGPMGTRFEAEVAGYVGATHGVAVNSATSALHLACLALDIGPGDEIWTCPNTFVASANCGRYCGAEVDFVDMDRQSYSMSVEALARKLEQRATDGRLPKVIIPVHFAGRSVPMQEIADLRDRYGFSIIEDASHAIGANYGTDKVGSCRYSDITVFSFHPVKVITSGEGGVAVTNNNEFAERMRRLRSHGTTRDTCALSLENPGPWYYEQLELGMNYRLTDIHAALGLSQLRRIREFVEKRRQLAARYNDLLQGMPVSLPELDLESAWHLYVIRLELDQISISRREVFDRMREFGIGVNVHYIPVHLQPYYQSLGFGPGSFPEAEAYYEEALTIPLFPAMSDADQDAVVESLERSLT
jgi:UDP-4-amino-4,6-dideoxy-N-acetyl-beta-L-altrosamine transaminase